MSVDSSALELGLGVSAKSSIKTKSATGVHCPGNKEVWDPKPDMKEIAEALRPEMPPLLLEEELFGVVTNTEGRDSDDE